jgi:GT2 family glycosyltransferase
VQLVRNPINIGYARAVNQGARLCRTPYLLLLNPDIRIPDTSIFAELVACMESDPQVAAAAPLQFKLDQYGPYLNFTWSYLSPLAFRFYCLQRFRFTAGAPSPVRVSFLNGGCLFLRMSAFEQVGMLNSKYFLYGEEPDLFLKFIRYGYECRLLTHVKIIHYRERSIGKVEPFKRLQLRLMALNNILDALINGLGAIVYDHLVRRLSFLPAAPRRNSQSH